MAPACWPAVLPTAAARKLRSLIPLLWRALSRRRPPLQYLHGGSVAPVVAGGVPARVGGVRVGTSGVAGSGGRLGVGGACAGSGRAARSRALRRMGIATTCIERRVSPGIGNRTAPVPSPVRALHERNSGRFGAPLFVVTTDHFHEAARQPAMMAPFPAARRRMETGGGTAPNPESPTPSGIEPGPLAPQSPIASAEPGAIRKAGAFSSRRRVAPRTGGLS